MQTNVSTKTVKIFVRDLPPLHEYVRRHKHLLADITYVLKLPSAISPQGIRNSLISAPILIADTANGKYTIGGFRTWALTKQTLDEKEKIPVTELIALDDDAIKELAISCVFANPMISEPEKSSISLLQQELEKLTPEERAIFCALLPGAASNKRYTQATGIREGTLYQRKNRAASKNEGKGDSNE